jgi:hypothetical protein
MKSKYGLYLGVLLGTTAFAGRPPQADIKQARLRRNAAIVKHDLDAIASLHSG